MPQNGAAAGCCSPLLLCHWHSHTLWVADSYAFHRQSALELCARFVLYFEVHFHKLPALPTLNIKCLCAALDSLSGCCLSRLGSSLGHRTLAFHCLISLCSALCCLLCSQCVAEMATQFSFPSPLSASQQSPQLFLALAWDAWVIIAWVTVLCASLILIYICCCFQFN